MLKHPGHLIIFINNCLMIVESLSIQHLGQFPLLPRTLLQLGSLVLEPDLDLILVQPQLSAQVSPPLLGQVSVCLELLSQLVELVRAEGSPGSLVISQAGAGVGGHHSRLLGLLHLPHPGSTAGSVRVSGAEDPGRDKLAIRSSDHTWRTISVSFGSLIGGLAQVNWNLNIHLWSGFWFWLRWFVSSCLLLLLLLDDGIGFDLEDVVD